MQKFKSTSREIKKGDYKNNSIVCRSTDNNNKNYQRNLRKKLQPNQKNWQSIPFDQASNKKLQDFGWQKRFSEQQVQNKKFLKITEDQKERQSQQKHMSRYIRKQTQRVEEFKIKKAQICQYQYKSASIAPDRVAEKQENKKLSTKNKQGLPKFKDAYDYFANLF